MNENLNSVGMMILILSSTFLISMLQRKSLEYIMPEYDKETIINLDEFIVSIGKGCSTLDKSIESARKIYSGLDSSAWLKAAIQEWLNEDGVPIDIASAKQNVQN